MILRDIRFPVQKATISANIFVPERGNYNDIRLEWFVEVEMEETDVDDGFFAPRISFNEFTLPVKRWTELEGVTLEADENDKPRRVVAVSYFWTHEMIPHVTLTIGKRRGTKFDIRLEGVLDPVFGEEPYEKNVPFLIETEAEFTQISVQATLKDTDETTRERLAQFIDVEDFVQQPMTETVHTIPAGNQDNFIERFLRRLLNRETYEYVSRYSVFLPKEK